MKTCCQDLSTIAQSGHTGSLSQFLKIFFSNPVKIISSHLRNAKVKMRLELQLFLPSADAPMPEILIPDLILPRLNRPSCTSRSVTGSICDLVLLTGYECYWQALTDNVVPRYSICDWINLDSVMLTGYECYWQALAHKRVGILYVTRSICALLLLKGYVWVLLTSPSRQGSRYTICDWINLCSCYCWRVTSATQKT